ncbi:nucleotidyltransferase family protein [Leptospira ognonensis]|uniref:Nucleotidyltransferase family protein n=1 Tax=Leptospira ognonensis TaxID=2484945 RepID=A0A4R9JTV7_9LEPT|nr:NTP transferase domain-containing protein [Leptospira ognonensis]TGL56209.1 nucleotidyltransferase family protein [Leptospira ognonensis]
MNRFFFLAAGFGKRMGNWTREIPKPLLKIDGISFLDYSLYLANKWGAEEAWINVHYLGNQITHHLGKFTAFPIKISIEKNILGTAGGIRTALESADFVGPIVLYNPDTLLFPSPLFKLRESLPENSKIHLYLSRLNNNDAYTKISINENQRIKFGKGDLFYIGLAILDPSILLTISPNEYFDLSAIFKSLAEKGEITGEIFDGETLDLGEKELYESYSNKNVFGETKSKILDFVSQYST